MSVAGDDPLAPLGRTLEGLAGRIAPTERARLARAIATDLRDANVRRIRANEQPDGSAMKPRKPRASLRGRRMRDVAPQQPVRTGPMFRKAAAAKHLKRQGTAAEARVGFSGSAARILRPHHYGLVDQVERRAGAPEADYPKRELLGFSAEDRLRVLERVEAAIAG